MMSSRESRAIVRGSARERSQSKERNPPDLSEASRLRILLLGKSASESSLVGNSILGRSALDSEAPPDVVERVGGRVKDRHVTLINSPHLLQTHISEQQITQTLRECVSLSDPGPHVVVLVLNPPCSAGDGERLEQLRDSLSDGLFQHSLVISTREPTDTDEVLQEILQRCSHRHFSLQTSSAPEEILQMCEEIQTSNGGRHLECVQKIHGDSQEITIQQQDKRGVSEGVNLVVCGSDASLKSSVSELILTDRRSVFVRTDVDLHTRLIRLLDLPALVQLSEQEVMRLTLRCVSLCHPGVHLFLLIIPNAPLNNEDRAEMEEIQRIFSSRINRHMMILIKQSSERQTAELNEETQAVLQSFGGRHHFIGPNTHVSTLMEKIEEMLEENRGDFYSTETFLETQMEKLMKNEQMKKKIDSLETHLLSPGSAENEGELRIVLLGKTGVGKSATGNTILGRDAFTAETSQESVTKESQRESSDLNERRVTVIDTPGLFDTELSDEEIRREITHCISMILPGPHVFIIVLNLGQRFTKHEEESVKILQEMFGEKSVMFTMVLFTRGDYLKDKTLDQCLGKPGSTIRKLTEACGNRVHVFNNNQTGDPTQVYELLEKIDNMVEENGGSFYSCKMFREMERERQERQMKILMDRDREREEEIKKHEEEKERMKRMMEEERQNQDEERKRREEELKREIREEAKHQREIRDEMRRERETFRHEIEEIRRKKEKIKTEKDNLKTEYDEERKKREEQFREREERYKTQLKEKEEREKKMCEEMKREREERDKQKLEEKTRREEEDEKKREEEQRLKHKIERMEREKEDLQSKHKAEENKMKILMEEMIREREEEMKKHEEEKERMKRMMEEERQNQEEERKRREEELKREIKEEEKHQREIRDEMRREQETFRQEIEEIRQEKEKIETEKNNLKTEYETEIEKLMNRIKNDRENNETERKKREEEFNQREEKYRIEIKEKEKQIQDDMRRERETFRHEREETRKEKEKIETEKDNLKTEYETKTNQIINEKKNQETERKRREEEFNEREEQYKTLMKEKEELMKKLEEKERNYVESKKREEEFREREERYKAQLKEKKEREEKMCEEMKREREEREKQKLEEKMRREKEGEKRREREQKLKQEKEKMEKEKEDLQSKHEAEENEMKILMEKMNREREEEIKKHEEENEKIKRMMEEEKQNQDEERKRREEVFNEREEQFRIEIKEKEKQIQDDMRQERETFRHEIEEMTKEREKIETEKDNLKTEYETKINRIKNEQEIREKQRKKKGEEFNEREEQHKTLMKEKEELMKKLEEKERNYVESKKREEEFREMEERYKTQLKEKKEREKKMWLMEEEQQNWDKKRKRREEKFREREERSKRFIKEREETESKMLEDMKQERIQWEKQQSEIHTKQPVQKTKSSVSDETTTSDRGKLTRWIAYSRVNTQTKSLPSRWIILLGKTGVGKSAAGNTILGQRQFRSEKSMSSVTSFCSGAQATVSDRCVSVVDTPGFFDTQMKPEDSAKEISRCVYLSSPGPHAFLIVFPVNMRFTEQEQQIPQITELMFGQEVLKYSIILFTHGDLLEGKTVKKLIEGNSVVRALVQQCGGRFHVFNNEDVSNSDQVNKLLQKIDSMVEQNGGGHYIHKMFEDAYRFRQEEKERRQREKEEQRLSEQRKQEEKQACVCS